MPLKRTLNLPLLIFYGLGSIIGAGIYALIGSVAEQAKNFTPISFLVAAIMALFTATTYAELSSRFPESAGSALFINKAFHKKWLSGFVGWSVVATGTVSSAALVHGLINYLSVYLPISQYLLIPIIIFLLGGITIWGITESVITIFIMTLLEILGLLIIIWYGRHSLTDIPQQLKIWFPLFDVSAWLPILSGAFLAFYAFIGFEDMVNVAEETKNPEKNMPAGIFVAAFSAAILYVLISYITTSSLNYHELAKSKTPLALIIKQQGHSPFLFSMIAMISIMNGILVNIIMASRLIYGMTKLKNAPLIFSKIYEKTQIPLFATLLVMISVLIMVYCFPIEELAKLTSTIILFIFCLMHVSLIKIKKMHSKKNNHFVIPIIFPIVGLVLSILFLASAYRF